MTWWWVLAMVVQPNLPDRCETELVHLDRTRAMAFVRADAAALDRVYVAGSPLLAADTSTIERYRTRGGRVSGALLRVASCRVGSRDDDTLRLEVVDALGPAVVRWDDGSTTRLPTDQPTRRAVTLRLTDQGWRISESRPMG